MPRFHGANSVLFAARPGPRPDYRIVRTVWWVSQLASMITSNVALLFPVALLTTLVAFGTWFAVVWNVVQAAAAPVSYAAFNTTAPAQQYQHHPPPSQQPHY